MSLADRTVLSLDQVHFGLSSLAGRITRRSGDPDLPGADRGAALAALHWAASDQADDGDNSILPVGSGYAGGLGVGVGKGERPAGSQKIQIIAGGSWAGSPTPPRSFV